MMVRVQVISSTIVIRMKLGSTEISSAEPDDTRHDRVD